MKKIKLILFTIFIMVAFSMPVNAMTIVLDPGHGGNESGTVGQENIYEKDVNLKIGLYLRDYLNKYQDVKVIMTRSDDSSISVYDRAMVARNNKADILISLHNNASATDETAHGVEAYVTSNTCLPKYQENTLKLATKIVNNISNLGIYNRGAKISPQIKEENGDYYYEGASADYYGIIRYAMRGCKMDFGEIKVGTYNDIRDGSGIPTVLVEHCFLKADNNFIDSDSDIQKIAEADGKAIVEFYGLRLIEDTKKDEEISEDPLTKPLDMYENIYQNYISTPIIPFKLIDANDRITGKDIKSAYQNSQVKLNGNNIKDSDQLQNGSIVEVNGKQYSVIIFGDTNNDGKINILDAVEVLNHVKGKKILKEASLIAGDTNTDGALNILEAVKILNVVKGKIAYNQLMD